MDEQARYQEAKKRVAELRGFYLHLVTYLVINAVLLLVNLLTSPRYLWCVWPLAGWGIGLAFHAMSVFCGLWGKSWEERKIKELMEKDRPSGSQ